MMQKVQRFGGALYVPVLLFPFAGVVIGLTILFKNPLIMGSLADPESLWYQCWFIIGEGAWAVLRQMPLLFAIGIPIALAKKAHARACMEALITYLTFNYFINAILTVWGSSFGVDFSAEVGSGTGLTTIAGIKTLDTNIIGAIVISSIVVFIHNRYFDKKLPDWLGIFQGTSYVVIVGFFVMIPLAIATSYFWPMVQNGISSMQSFLGSAGVAGVWLYTFLERILLPTGLHHFIWTPFLYGPAIIEGGIKIYWIEHLTDFAASTQSLKALFPEGGFAMYGNAKIFAMPGIALALYATAKPEKKKLVASLLIPATLTAVVAGITEPLEFTFLFISPLLFGIHALLAATMSATMYAFGITGLMTGGLIEIASNNWIPLFSSHGSTYLLQIGIGLVFTFIYYIVFRTLILKLNIATPGREQDSESGTKLYSKKDFKDKQEGKKLASSNGGAGFSDKALSFLEALGGAENIEDVMNCATRLRVTVRDEKKLQSDGAFQAAGAHGVVRNGKAIQIIVGLSVPQVREQFELLLKEAN